MFHTHRPRDRQSKPLVQLQLTVTQRAIIADRYKSAYTDQGVWPDIKLEAFIQDVTEDPPIEPVPVYFAQRLELLKFAELNGLPWLTDMIRNHVLKSMHPIPEDAA